jgi:hypothetical protein
MAAHLGEWQALLERAKAPEDRLFYVDYADLRWCVARNGNFLRKRRGDAHCLAAQHALSLMPQNRAARILALTDGFSTEPLTALPSGSPRSACRWITASPRRLVGRLRDQPVAPTSASAAR